MTETYGEIVAPDTVRFERLLPGPIGRVWDYLTDPALRGEWLASGPMELRPGGKVELRFKHSELTTDLEDIPEKFQKAVEGFSMQTEVTVAEPPHRLAFLWGSPERRSEVTFELSEAGDRVRLVLTHARLPDRAGLLDVSGGWHIHLRVLENRLNGRGTPRFWAPLQALNADYAERFGADAA